MKKTSHSGIYPLEASRPRHNGDAFSRRHPPMAVSSRAKIFAPFAALKGHDQALARQKRHMAPLRLLADEERLAINRRLQHLCSLLNNGQSPMLKLIYFMPDSDLPDRGITAEQTGKLAAIDPLRHAITLAGKDAVPFDHLYAVCFADDAAAI
jgi:hypothetical protein